METTNTSSCFSCPSSQESQPEAEAVPESKKRVREEVAFFPLTSTLNKGLWEERQKNFMLIAQFNQLNEAHKQLRGKYDLMKKQLTMLLAEKKQSQSQMTLPMTVEVETVSQSGKKCVYYVKPSPTTQATYHYHSSYLPTTQATSSTASADKVSSQTK